MNSDLDLDTTLPPPPEYLVGVAEAAKFFRCETPVIVYWAEHGIIPAQEIRHNGQTFYAFRVSELSAWREQCRRDTGPKGLRQLTARTRTVLGRKRKPTASRRGQKP